MRVEAGVFCLEDEPFEQTMTQGGRRSRRGPGWCRMRTGGRLAGVRPGHLYCRRGEAARGGQDGRGWRNVDDEADGGSEWLEQVSASTRSDGVPGQSMCKRLS